MKTELIVALDVDSFKKASELVNILYPAVQFYKIGSLFDDQGGQKLAKIIAQKGGKIFIDKKIWDIPNTIGNFSYIATDTGSTTRFPYLPAIFQETIYPVFMISILIVAGLEALEEAKKGAMRKAMEAKINSPKIVGVTVLTSEAADGNTQDTVLARAQTAKDAGLDGIVCSMRETAAVRARFGKDFIIVNPGIRPTWAEKGDQKRVATPSDAKNAGANYIVVGRPIIKDDKPLKAAEDIFAELA